MAENNLILYKQRKQILDNHTSLEQHSHQINEQQSFFKVNNSPKNIKLNDKQKIRMNSEIQRQLTIKQMIKQSNVNQVLFGDKGRIENNKQSMIQSLQNINNKPFILNPEQTPIDILKQVKIQELNSRNSSNRSELINQQSLNKINRIPDKNTHQQMEILIIENKSLQYTIDILNNQLRTLENKLQKLKNQNRNLSEQNIELSNKLKVHFEKNQNSMVSEQRQKSINEMITKQIHLRKQNMNLKEMLFKLEQQKSMTSDNVIIKGAYPNLLKDKMQQLNNSNITIDTPLNNQQQLMKYLSQNNTLYQLNNNLKLKYQTQMSSLRQNIQYLKNKAKFSKKDKIVSVSPPLKRKNTFQNNQLNIQIKCLKSNIYESNEKVIKMQKQINRIKKNNKQVLRRIQSQKEELNNQNIEYKIQIKILENRIKQLKQRNDQSIQEFNQYLTCVIQDTIKRNKKEKEQYELKVQIKYKQYQQDIQSYKNQNNQIKKELLDSKQQIKNNKHVLIQQSKQYNSLNTNKHNSQTKHYDNFQKIMNSFQAKSLDHESIRTAKSLASANILDKIFQKCFQISQLIPQQTTQFFFVPQNQIEYLQQMALIKYFVENTLSRQQKKDNLLIRKQNTYFNFIKDLIIRSEIQQCILEEVIQKSNIMNNNDFDKLKFQLSLIRKQSINSNYNKLILLSKQSYKEIKTDSDMFFDFENMQSIEDQKRINELQTQIKRLQAELKQQKNKLHEIIEENNNLKLFQQKCKKDHLKKQPIVVVKGRE